MIEPIMYGGIGFLCAALLVLGVIPLVHARAVRLTMKRLEAVTPMSMAKIQADKDQLRAEFAMSTRRLEMSVEQMKLKTTGQLAEIGNTSAAIGRLKAELLERSAAFTALQEKEAAVSVQLRSTEAELAARSKALEEVEATLAARKAELARFMADINVHPEVARIRELHRTEIDNLKADKAQTEEQLRQSREECVRPQCQIEATNKQIESNWASERMANAVLRERINDVASEVVRVAVALEGLTSPIETLAAAKATSERAEMMNVNGDEDVFAATPADGEDAKATLVHRVRALRNRSPQLPAPG